LLEVVENKEGRKGTDEPRILRVFAHEAGRAGEEECGADGDRGEHFEAQCKKAFNMLAWNYDSVNTPISD